MLNIHAYFVSSVLLKVAVYLFCWEQYLLLCLYELIKATKITYDRQLLVSYMLLGVNNFLLGDMEDYLLTFLGICPAPNPAKWASADGSDITGTYDKISHFEEFHGPGCPLLLKEVILGSPAASVPKIPFGLNFLFFRILLLLFLHALLQFGGI